LFRRLLKDDVDTLQARLGAVLAKSERLSLVVTMRTELEALWARSTASHEQLVAQLQDWVARAEASGIAQLEEFSLRLRRYAV
jgi:stearoyl-CoA desaturase (delta-9 desaturase)